MERHVFIPTKGRSKNIGKLCNIWQEKDFTVHLAVEEQEWRNYDKVTSNDVDILVLTKNNQGISYARNSIVGYADELGLKSIILADDDIKPSTRRPDGMAEIFDSCEHPKVLGMTARYSYHDLCLGEDIKDMDDIILLSTGTFRIVGLNIGNVMELGNYDLSLEYAEDCDLFLRGLEAGFPWMVHLGSFSNSMGTRYEPGGMLDFAGGEDRLTIAKINWHNDIRHKWPKFVNNHTEKCKGKQNCISIQWKRAYDYYLPNWREWSELDGGDLNEYTDA